MTIVSNVEDLDAFLCIGLIVPIFIPFVVPNTWWLIALPVVGGLLLIMVFLFRYKVIINEQTRIITVRRKFFWSLPRKYDIAFSSVASIGMHFGTTLIVNANGGIRKHEIWKLYLNTDRGKVRIGHAEYRDDIHKLGTEISRLIRKELVEDY